MGSERFAELSDEELVVMTNEAPSGAEVGPFETLVDRYQDKILANCRYLTRAPNDAEDLAQDVFVKAFFALGRFEGRSKFRTWLQRIKINHCLNFNDKKRGKYMVDVETPGIEVRTELHTKPQGEARVRSLDERRQIAQVLDEMSSTLRVPLLLRDLDGMSYQEIADQLDIGLSAVKMRIKRARTEFRALYEREDEVSSAEAVEAGGV